MKTTKAITHSVVICLLATSLISQTVIGQETANLDVRLEVLQKINLPAKTQGFLETVNLAAGTTIKKGELLAELDVTRERLEEKRLKAEIKALAGEIIKSEQASRVAQYRVSELNKARMQTHIPHLEILQAESDANSAVAALTSASATLKAKQAELELIEHSISEARIESPFDGIVFKQYKQPGEAVEQGETLAEIYRLDYLRGTVLLKQDEMSPQDFLAIKGSVQIKFPGGSSKSYSITEPQALPRLERDGRFLGIVKIKNRKSKSNESWQLLPGMSGKLIQGDSIQGDLIQRDASAISAPSLAGNK